MEIDWEELLANHLRENADGIAGEIGEKVRALARELFGGPASSTSASSRGRATSWAS